MPSPRWTVPILTALFLVRPAWAEPATRPSLADQVAELVEQLGNDSFSQRQQAISTASHLPADALPLFEAAEKQPNISEEVHENLDTVIHALRQETLRQSKYDTVLDFYRSHLAIAYGRVGKKNPAWDGPVQNLLEGTARQFADQLCDRDNDTQPLIFFSDIRNAHCDDPLAAMCGNWVGWLPSVAQIDATDAAMAASQYSSFIKLKALAWIAADAQDTPTMPDYYAKAKDYLKRSVNLWAATLSEDPNIPPGIALKQAEDQIETGKQIGMDRKDIFDQIDSAMAKTLPAESLIRLNLKGKFLIDYAWDARGDGWANTVTADRKNVFSARLADAEKALTRCYELYPDDPHAATEMLTVELGQGQGGQREELWFERAMKADPENYAACEATMNYLAPRWYGSAAAQLAFGKECLSTGRFKSRIPLFVVDGHFAVATLPPWASEVPWPYFAQNDVWKDISTAYTRYFDQHPDAWQRRGKYAYYAWMAGKRTEALKQYQIIESGPGSFRQSDMLRLVQIELAIHPPNQPAVDPTPQLDAIARKNTDDLKHLMVDAYDQVGNKNPTWDAPARAALRAAAEDWGKDPNRDFSEPDTILQSAKHAIDAGCDDPLVHFVYSYTIDTCVSPEGANKQQISFADGVAMLSSRYPAFIRLRALTWCAMGKIWKTKIPDGDRAAVFTALDAGIATLKLATIDHSVTDRVFALQVNELLNCYLGMVFNEPDSLFQRAQTQLEAGNVSPALLKRIRIGYYSDYFDAIGAVGNIPNRREGNATVNAPSELDELEPDYEQLWQDDPTDPYPILQLLKRSHMAENPRPQIDFWTYIALRANPHSYEAGLQVLTEFRWGQVSWDDTQNFCQAAVATADYRSQVPFLMVNSIDQYARNGNDDPSAKPSADIISDPESWSSIANIYDACLQQFPLDSTRRSQYASYACLVGNWQLAAQQLKILGDRVKPRAFYTSERLAACQRQIKELTAKGYLSGSQNAAP